MAFHQNATGDLAGLYPWFHGLDEEFYRQIRFIVSGSFQGQGGQVGNPLEVPVGGFQVGNHGFMG